MQSFLDQLSPYQFTPEQMAILEVQDDMRRVTNDLALVYAQSYHGYSLLAEHLERSKAALIEQIGQTSSLSEAQAIYDKISGLLISNALPDRLVTPPAVGSTRNLLTRNSVEGENITLLGAFCLIALYQHWEDSWRPRIAKAMACDKNELKSDFWGDVRLLRICVIHKRGRQDFDGNLTI